MEPTASNKDIPFKPARVLMQDFTGVPAVVDIASLCSEIARKRKNADEINPLVPVDLIIDHSAYAIAGRIDIDLINEPLSFDPNQQPVSLKDIWPTNDEITELMNKALSPHHFAKNYGEIFEGNEIWRNLEILERLYMHGIKTLPILNKHLFLYYFRRSKTDIGHTQCKSPVGIR